MKLWMFIKDNLPFAFTGNPSCKYSEQEYNLAKSNLNRFVSHFKNLDEELLVQSFACVVKHIKFVKNDYVMNWTVESMKKKGKSYEQYHKMISELYRVMQSFKYGFEGELENKCKTFPIKQVIFKGTKKEQTIKLEGFILDILEKLFISFNTVYGKMEKQKMKDFSFDFYEAYQEFEMQWIILNAGKGTIADRVIKAQEESNIEIAFNRYRNQTAFYIYSFLKKYDRSNKIIPEWHKKFIGNLFIACGIAHDEKKKGDEKNEKGYIDISNYNTVRRWIEEGEKSLNS